MANTVWTCEDLVAGECTPRQVGSYKVPVWTCEDWGRMLCEKDQIGKPKDPTIGRPLTPNPQQVAAELSAPHFDAATLRQDILQAYKQLGGVKYLVQNPALLQKLLLKIANGPALISQAPITINVPWLTPDRLAYKRGSALDLGPAAITDAVITGDAQRASNLASQQSWKDEAQSPTRLGARLLE